MAVILNFILLILIIAGMFKRREKACLKSLMFYTILSNLINAFASLLVLIFGLKYFVEVIRYLSVCMMVMTFFVTECILMPVSKGSRPFLYKGSGLLHHVICPALSLVSYIFCENRVKMSWVWLPVAVTLLYGVTMVLLNKAGRVDGPYPFFQIRTYGVKKVVLWMALLMVATSALSAGTGYNKPMKSDIKFVFVHGLSGWGSYDRVNDLMPYWGLTGGSVIRYLNNEGYESYAASVNPSTSAWDRACELYAQLTGTVVDYGKAHSERCNHPRFGEDFTGRALLKDFGESRFVLLGHSFGGATVRLFSEILRNGDAVEREATDEGDLSPFFAGGHGEKLFAVVTLSAPTNGTTAYDVHEDPNFDLSKISVPEEYEKYGNYVSKGTKAKEDGRIKEDYASFDMHIDNALELNSRISTFGDVYYFAVPCASTVTDADGNVNPDESITEKMFLRGGLQMSKYTGATPKGFVLDESWQPNDGLVNTISAGAPFNAPSADYVEGSELQKGIWYVFPTFRGDHMSLQGGLTKRINIKPFYMDLVRMISGLK